IGKLTQYCTQYCNQSNADCNHQGDADDAEIEGLYTGSRQAQSKAELLIDGEEGEEFIKRLIAARKLTKLAQLWVMGMEIRWDLLHSASPCSYQARKPRRISLPPYPFAKERYWMPENSQGYDGQMQGLHPLLDKIVPSLSLHEGLVFQKTLQYTDLVVREHKVKGQSLLPGVGYLEIVRAAIFQIKGNNNFSLSQVVWLRPLTVRKGKKEVQIIIKEDAIKENDELVQYELRSSHNTGNPIVHARGKACFNAIASQSTSQWIPIEEIKARCTRQIDKEAIYSRFKENGINYGTYFQALSLIWLNEDEALGQLVIPAGYENELKKYTLHPSLMDGALQTISGCCEKTPRTLVPFMVEKLEILHPLKPRGYAYVKALGNHRFHVAISDEAGLVCVKLHDVVMRELKDNLQNFFYCSRWMENPLNPAQEDKDTQDTQKDKDTQDTRKDRDTQDTQDAQDAQGNRKVLIMYPPQSFGLEKALAEAHPKDEIIKIELGTKTWRHGDNYWEINTEAPSSPLDNCISQLTAPLNLVYFLGGIQQGPKPDVDDLDALEHSQERGVISLFRLIQSLIHHNLIQHPLKLKVITNDAHQIAFEQIANPYAASLFGFTKTIAREYPMLEASCIDISLKEIETNPTKEKMSALVRTILVEPGNRKGAEVAIRQGRRYMRTLVPVNLPFNLHSRSIPSLSHSQVPFRHQGVYMILGGAGGIGLELSRYLARTVQARLVLLGRSEKLSTEQREKIARIEAHGGKVLYLQADATDLESMRAAVARAKEHFGSIHGVI
ncbi:MAG: SDR family NAD(P)-dependent oxidoreductase, partial [Spirochaetota bacterium]